MKHQSGRHAHVHQAFREALDAMGGAVPAWPTEAELLAADRERNENKAERAIEREAERALDLQIKHQNLPGAWA